MRSLLISISRGGSPWRENSGEGRENFEHLERI